ncbi:MAG: hypothetical protein RL238_1252 [Actinomycetota bacterium]|jgi:hypothetical protein
MITVIVASSEIPVAVPLAFLAFGIFFVIVNRRMFTHFDGELHRMAERRANSNIVRALGGSGDAAKEYESLRRSRWIASVTLVAYFTIAVVALVKALTE